LRGTLGIVEAGVDVLRFHVPHRGRAPQDDEVRRAALHPGGVIDGLDTVSGGLQQVLQSAPIGVFFGYAGGQLLADFVEVGSEGVGIGHALPPLTGIRHNQRNALIIADSLGDAKGIAAEPMAARFDTDFVLSFDYAQDAAQHADYSLGKVTFATKESILSSGRTERGRVSKDAELPWLWPPACFDTDFVLSFDYAQDAAQHARLVWPWDNQTSPPRKAS